ncbi:MAG: hypothetical protein HOV67_04020 [Kribbellaceae bacterium]|nr:hypothetical protein [Kribbellaceae bacterium]
MIAPDEKVALRRAYAWGQGGSMACGNNHVSRAYLSSPPTPPAIEKLLHPAEQKPVEAERKTANKELGDRGEALVARLMVEAQDHALVYQHTPGEPSQGVDIVTIDPNGRLVVTEVKSTAAKVYDRPKTRQNVRDHQLDADWTAKNLTRTGHVDIGPEAVGPAADQVIRQLAQFDAVSGTVTFWDVTSDGRRADTSPTEIWDSTDFEDAD